MNDPVHDIIRALKPLFSKHPDLHTILSKLRSIFISEAVSQVFVYFCIHGASTAWVLQCELNMPEATVYRSLRRLRTVGVLVPAIKVSKIKHSRGGPRPTIWVLEDATPAEVTEARRIHYRMISLKEEVKISG